MHAARVAQCTAAAAALLVSATGCGSATPQPSPQALQMRVAAPESVALDPSGNLYVSEFEGNRIDRISPEGALRVVARLTAPAGLALATDGGLLVADHAGNRIVVVDSDGHIATFRGSVAAGLHNPIGIAREPDGALVVADELNSRVLRIAPSGGAAVLADGLNHPSYIVVSPDRSVFFSDFLDNRVRKIDRSGAITTVAGTGSPGFTGDGGPATEAELNFPTGLALDPDGNLYVSDSNNNRVRRIDPRGVITTAAGSGTAGFAGDGGPAIEAELNTPAGLALDRAGRLYIADQGNNRVRRVDVDGTITTVAGRG